MVDGSHLHLADQQFICNYCLMYLMHFIIKRDTVLSPASIILSRRRRKRQASSTVLEFGDMSIIENVTGVSQLQPSDYFGKFTIYWKKIYQLFIFSISLSKDTPCIQVNFFLMGD